MKKLILILLIGTLLALPMSALALEKMSGKDLSGVSGQAGVTLAFGGTSTTTITFDSVAWGDEDGCVGSGGAACGGAGWIIIDGAITITQTIADGETLTLDVGTTTGLCTPAGAVNIPAATSFIAIGLPDTTTTVTVPSTLTIGLGDTSTAIDGTLGMLYLENLSVTPGTPTALYIWAHT